MRKLLAAAIVCFGASAFACPDLSGEYTCTNAQGAAETLTVSQVLGQDGITTYTVASAMGTYAVAANGIDHNFASTSKAGHAVSTNIAVKCYADAAVVQNATFTEADAFGAVISSGASSMLIQLDASNNLAMAGSCSKDGVEQVVKQTCTRIAEPTR